MEPTFRFKQFSVRHDRCIHKVGTDAVLLGAWTNVEGATKILDIGTGSGILALMLAQRTASDVTIDAVEPGQADFLQATENALASPWSNRIKVHEGSIQDYKPAVSYDLMVSNPPFFRDSLLPPTAGRQRARHTQSLSHIELLVAVDRLLSGSGTFSIVLPTKEGQAFESQVREFGLSCSRRLAIFSRTSKPQERLLMEFMRYDWKTTSETLVLYEDANQWSAAYKKLTRDFYLQS